MSVKALIRFVLWMPPVLIQEDHTLACVNLVLKEMDFAVVQVRLLLKLHWDDSLTLVRYKIRFMHRPSTDQYTIFIGIIALLYMYILTVDINECLANNGSCHNCSNTAGSYKCYCNSGFRIVEYNDGVTKTCIGKWYCKCCNFIPIAEGWKPSSNMLLLPKYFRELNCSSNRCAVCKFSAGVSLWLSLTLWLVLKFIISHQLFDQKKILLLYIEMLECQLCPLHLIQRYLIHLQLHYISWCSLMNYVVQMSTNAQKE